MRLVITPSAHKQLTRVPRYDAERIGQRIEGYAADPAGPGHDVVKLAGSVSQYRLRVGDWRVVFSVEGDLMTVERVGHRREVYR